MAEPTHWRLQLNNLLQISWGVHSLRWEQSQTGSQHSSPWVAVAFIQNVEWGRGQAHSLGAAKEEAARVAYRALYRHLYHVDP
ncbi:uncharacterized protein PHACADRAFT_204628 [Phanerochaete carnosa HHB-10118-sp]|uniref:DRBM domain-containing protein n=1 Tax=Phanerochaete carnosa (strain HHB-10118-sp) TaxID=650164 RepID=K5WQE9_PHACS|nr:uncharacterized protein PHACADRAFT_204628 [Phanerochaete carnosa HHB-10118-sp]EKM61459.1 hypothetical protein PHACADRAFT_204628 [Phanerochaete carnosa HHB-10118-sp]